MRVQNIESIIFEKETEDSCVFSRTFAGFFPTGMIFCLSRSDLKSCFDRTSKKNISSSYETIGKAAEEISGVSVKSAT